MKSKSKTKILLVIHNLGLGGSERVVLELTQKLNTSKFEVFLAAFDRGSLEESFHHRCSQVFIVQKKPGFDMLAMLQLAKIVRKNKIDVINAHHFMPLFYSFMAAKLFNRKRLIFTEHSVPEVEAVYSGFYRKVFNIFLSQIDAVVGVSNEITHKFRIFYPRYREKIKNVPNAVDLERFKNRVIKNGIREKWGIPQGHFVIGMVANFRQIKNHACLVRAVSRLKDDFPNVSLFLVGAGYPGFPDDTEQEIRQLVNNSGLQQRVVFSGHQKEIPEILPMFDVFCLPSFSEGLPVSILEAMAARVPVIGSRARGIIEVVKHRSTGLLFDIDNDEELAGLLRKIINDHALLKKLSDNGYQYVIENHGSSSWINRYSELFLGK